MNYNILRVAIFKDKQTTTIGCVTNLSMTGRVVNVVLQVRNVLHDINGQFNELHRTNYVSLFSVCHLQSLKV